MKKILSNMWFYAAISMILVAILADNIIFIAMGIMALFLAVFMPSKEVKNKKHVKR